LGIDNVLLRGSIVRNTEYVFGLAIYQGHDTKIMRNSAKAKMKYSKLERQTNKTIGIMLLLSICIAFIGAIVGSTWTMNYGGSVHYIFGLEPPFPK
jgi:phospholipid-transporting ATPase